MISQQQAQYLILTLAAAFFLALAMWLNIHFIWAALISALLITQSAVTGWTIQFKVLKLRDNPNHSLKSLLTRHHGSAISPKILKIVEPVDTNDSPHSFASYQKLKQTLHQHEIKLKQLQKNKKLSEH